MRLKVFCFLLVFLQLCLSLTNKDKHTLPTLILEHLTYLNISLKEHSELLYCLFFNFKIKLYSLMYTYNISSTKKKFISRTSRKIKKRLTPLDSSPQIISLSSFDSVFDQCFNIHKQLLRSNRILSAFSRELNTISEYVYNTQNQAQLDDITVDYDITDQSGMLNHRYLNTNIDEPTEFYDAEFTKEDFQKEILKISYLNDVNNENNQLGRKKHQMNNTGQESSCFVDKSDPSFYIKD